MYASCRPKQPWCSVGKDQLGMSFPVLLSDGVVKVIRKEESPGRGQLGKEIVFQGTKKFAFSLSKGGSWRVDQRERDSGGPNCNCRKPASNKKKRSFLDGRDLAVVKGGFMTAHTGNKESVQ